MVNDSNKRSILPLNLVNATVRKRAKIILENVSAEFGIAGFSIVMGPNGAGKSTLMRLMHGLERPREGSVSWAVDTTIAAHQQAFVFQTPVLMRRTVLDNAAYPLIVRGIDKNTARSKALEALQHVGLLDHNALEAHFLSGGERQKLALARALITGPQVLFLDEPTANLDGRSTREIETILLSASTAGTRIIMATHDIGQAKRLASEIVFLNRGRICEISPSARFFEQPLNNEARAFIRGDIVE